MTSIHRQDIVTSVCTFDNNLFDIKFYNGITISNGVLTLRIIVGKVSDYTTFIKKKLSSLSIRACTCGVEDRRNLCSFLGNLRCIFSVS